MQVTVSEAGMLDDGEAIDAMIRRFLSMVDMVCASFERCTRLNGRSRAGAPLFFRENTMQEANYRFATSR
jgi:hypothetical protein